MTTHTTTNGAARRRLIRTEGDGAAVYRVSKNHTAHAAVYVYPTPDDSPQSHTDMATVSLHVDAAGGWRVTLSPAWVRDRERPAPVTVAAGNVDLVPAVVPADGPDSTVFAWVIDGQIHRGTVDDLARWAVACQIGYAEDPLPSTVYAPTTTGALVPVPVVVECGPYDSSDWAPLTVTVTLAPGRTAVGFDRVDGRA